jgi:hypothetical protein
MKRDPFGSSFFAPFIQWNSLVAQTAEMMLASAQVIGHRTQRMALAGSAPGARDRREFALMGREKVEAGAQSFQAMTSHVLNRNQHLAARAFSDMLRSTSALVMLASSRSPAQLFARQMGFARTLERSAVSVADVAKSATRLAHRGLKPIHAKATANAKRLGKRG